MQNNTSDGKIQLQINLSLKSYGSTLNKHGG